ncbi:MAG TPA: hypothetical protein DEF89_15695, partial [Desulfosporosinus sp.]|nr:hypothetical protein [Desulfosporosinus sp.]
NITKKVLSTSYSTIHKYDRLIQIELSTNVEGIATGDLLDDLKKKFRRKTKETVSPNLPYEKRDLSVNQNSY